MKKIVLKVVKQCVGTDGVEPAYVREDVLPEFFQNFWVRRMALDRRNYKQVVETTVELANKVGGAEIILRVVDDLKDESEPYRRMVMETVEQVIQNLGAADVDARLEEQLVDGALYAFQEQTSDETQAMLQGFGTVVNALGARVLGSILGGLKAIVNVIDDQDDPPHQGPVASTDAHSQEPHEKVQENCIDLVGRQQIGWMPAPDVGRESRSARSGCICFELLEMLKAHKKAIRRAAVNTFGYIAKAIGPQGVLHTLLNNLKVQERQNRVCTTVAIAIVAETCSPFTVLPALMNEYRVPELNVQNGVLKALSFMFEYIGEMGKDYIYAVAPLLEDALMDRDLVHRQTSCTTVKHLALGVAGLGCEDALTHLLNYVWPNIFEVSPHMINACFEAIGGCAVALGPTRVLQYVLQGMYHPARRVRDVYWKIYNSLYIYGADALTPAYPRLEDEGANTYRRTHLELFV
ncbi:unnamed protein product [Heterosigma akashiwo]